MKLIYLLFISLIALSNCITPVIKESKTRLTGNSFYLIGASYYSGNNLFLDFEDRSYYLDNYIQVCFTDTLPYDGIPCFGTTYIKYAYRSSINSDTDLTYYFYYKYSDGKYIIVKFNRFSGHSGGNLYVKASNNDTHNLATAALGIVSIVLIVIGSIIVLSIVITILICCCLCRKRTIGGQVGYIQPTYVVTNPNPVTYPLSPNGY